MQNTPKNNNEKTEHEASEERRYERWSETATNAQQNMIEAAVNIANLALLSNIDKAIAFYRKALQLNPTHPEATRLLEEALALKEKA